VPGRLTILLVEDNAADALLTQQAFADIGANVEFEHALTGLQALQMYRADPRRFQLILLDLNMPEMTGHELLTELGRGDEPALTPVVVLSSSQSPHDVSESYRLAAAAYVPKPVDYNGYVRIAQGVVAFWVELVRFAPSPDRD
jgi:chemotaxis family two-component system response regulator Rcp1